MPWWLYILPLVITALLFLLRKKIDRWRFNRVQHVAKQSQAGRHYYWGRIMGTVLLLGGSILFFTLWIHGRNETQKVSTLQTCTSISSLPKSNCLEWSQGVIRERNVDRGSQELVIAFSGEDKHIWLSDDGWAGDWRGHFPVGEKVDVEFKGSTPLIIKEASGHERKTASNPAGDTGFFLFMAIFSLVSLFPVFFLLRAMDRSYERAAREGRTWLF